VETKEDKIRWLEFVLENSRMVETYELALLRSRPGSRADAVIHAKYGRLDAEISLLKFKRDPAILAKSKLGFAITQNNGESSNYDLESLQKLMNKLAIENATDDGIRKLQRQRLESALNSVKALRERLHVGQRIDASYFFKFIKIAGSCALELADTNEERIQCLEFVLETCRREELRVLRLQEVGARGGMVSDAALATYWRLDAEINLRTYIRDPAMRKQSPMKFTLPQHDSRARRDNVQAHQVFLNNLAKERANDDEIRKLQRQRLETALLGAEALRKRSEQGYISISFLVEAQRIAGLAALELAETREEQMQCLEFVLELSRKAEDRVLELQKFGMRGGEDDFSQATYWRLDAEINLLQFKRESATANSVKNGSSTVLNHPPGAQLRECLLQQTFSASKYSCAPVDRLSQQLEAHCQLKSQHYKSSNLGRGSSRIGNLRSLTYRRSKMCCN
jgi:hypothetical protein